MISFITIEELFKAFEKTLARVGYEHICIFARRSPWPCGRGLDWKQKLIIEDTATVKVSDDDRF